MIVFALAAAGNGRNGVMLVLAEVAIARPTVGLIGRVRYQTVGLDSVDNSGTE